jgi:GT2 family glycosyltransferase
MRGTALIVLAWNQWPLTRRCLDSLLDTDLDGAEIIVVDNGSDDETPAALAAYAGRVRIVRLSCNFGFVRGMNAGIAAARPADDVVLLNNDLEFNQRDWLGRLRDAAYAGPDHGIVGCRLRGAVGDDRLYHVATFIEAETLWGQQTESGLQERDVGQYTRLRRVQGIAFAVAYLRRDLIERIGMLDEAFHSYFEDTDYCLRAADAGVATVVAGAVTLRHEQHGSTRDDGGFRQRLWERSKTTFAARWRQRLLELRRGSLHWVGSTRQVHATTDLTHDLVWRLEARGLHASYAPARTELPSIHDYRLAHASERAVPDLPDVSLACLPHLAPARPARLRTAFAFSESARLGQAEVEAGNGYDRLFVPDDHQADVFRQSGIRTPIEVVDPGVDIDYFHPGVPALRTADGRFVFLSIASALERDAPEMLVRAFRHAFTARDPVELLLYVEPGNDEAAIRDALAPLLTPLTGGRVRLLAGTAFPRYQRGMLFAAADAYASARRGGGWDLEARRAVAVGLPLIAPAHGSQREFVARWGHAVSHTASATTAGWIEVDIEAMASALRLAFEQRDERRAHARAEAMRFARQHSVDAGVELLIERLDAAGVLKPRAPKPVAHPPARATVLSGQIIVLGMHRSGTSSIGGLLALFGAWPGPHDQLLRGDDNPKGHFEHGELHMACVRRLAAASGDWKHPPESAPAEAIDAFRREAGAVLDTLEPRRPWFAKEPRLCLLAGELLPLLTHPVFVHVARDPLGVADSLARRDGMSRDEALALWELYTRSAFAASKGWPRVLVDYDVLMARPVETARRLHADLSEAGVGGLVMPADATILAWVDAPSRTAPSDDAAALTPAQTALRDAIRDRSILADDHRHGA